MRCSLFILHRRLRLRESRLGRAIQLGVLASLLPTARAGIDFATEIQPVLEGRCLECHRGDKPKGGLRLDRIESVLRGGDAGPGVVVGAPDQSSVINRILRPADDDERMPPRGEPLTAAQQAVFKQWVAEGAAWPAGVTARYRSPAELKQQSRAAARQAQLRELRVYPGSVTLETRRDAQGLVVMAVYADDVTIDVTPLARFSVADPALARFENATVYPTADGTTEVVVEYGGRRSRVPLTVKGAAADRRVSFALDVMPGFMRAGCNTGGCHGSARGKDGFRLSLFGFDPEGDYQRLTREMAGRRINLNLPASSLVVEKATGLVAHSGGRRYDTNSPIYATLLEWIRAGAPHDPPAQPTLEGIEIQPRELVLEGRDATQQLTVRARYSDGTDRDVTGLTVFGSNNDTSVAVAADGLVHSGEPGEAFVLARFGSFAVGTQAIVIPEALDHARPTATVHNYIDELVNAKLHRLRLLPSGECGDEEFIRRVSLDVTGRMPTPEAVRAFGQDAAPDKRGALVDELLGRKEFIELWVMKWAELLQIRSSVPGANRNYKSALAYYNWLQARLAANVPLNEIARELLAASGGTFTQPAANFYELEKDTLKLTENVAQVFTGMRIQCAQCHNHPFDRWTMDDYYGFAAFFSQVGRKAGEDPRETVIFNAGGGETPHPVTKKPLPPRFLGGDVAQLDGRDRRAVVADWLAAPDNPYFARNLANLAWAHFFGVGIIEPVDDVRVSNPPSNPPLLDALAAHLREYGYDLRRLVRDIATSAAYQRTAEVNPSNARDGRNFSHALVRRLRAEVLLDAISQVTETPNKFKGLPRGARAVQIADGDVSNYFLTTFGRATRATVCSCEVRMEPSLSQALHLINGDATGQRIKNGDVVGRLLKDGRTPTDVLDSLYLRCLGRAPRAGEAQALAAQVTAVPADRQRAALEDVFWALLNSKEFMFNH